MKLFDIIPDKFYSILNGKNKNIYVAAILLLYKLINENDMTVRKDDYSRALKETLAKELERFDFEEEGEEFDPSQLTSATKTSYILRRLEETGWIVLDLDPETLEEFIVLPSYSIKTIASLFDIINESSEGYSSLVHTTYSELLVEDSAKDEFMYATLLRAYENTKKLRLDLITLSHSIKIYQSRLARLYSSNEVLHSYYDSYKELISDRLYHPLKTFDSVTRFKRPIINILNSWLKNEETKNILSQQCVIYSKKSNLEEAQLDIAEKINYICDNYESLHKMIDKIDKSHRDYTKSSTNKILYFNNNDKSVKGNIESILMYISKNQDNHKALRPMLIELTESINLHQSGFMNPDSITLPFNRKALMNEGPLEIMDNELITDEAMRQFVNSINGMFTDESIFNFMKEVFEDKNEIDVEDIRLVNFDAFILLILATIKKDDELSFYNIEFDGKKAVHTWGYIVPKMKFIRKEK